MILEVFTLFTALAVILVGVGLFQKEPVHAIIGFSFFFVLGVLLMGGAGSIVGTVNIQTGENITFLNDTLTVVNYNYEPLNDNNTQWFGRFLAITGVLGVALMLFRLPSMIERKNNERKKDESYESY